MTNALANTSWVDVPDRPLVLVPLGSTEQHGPHLPFSTDTLIATAVARGAADDYRDRTGTAVIVAPAVAYGASGEHQGFPGTISIGHEALRSMLVEMVRSLSAWAGSVVFVNGHGGNTVTLKAVVDQMRFEQHQVSMVICALETTADAHAGFDETSVMLHLHPELVDMARAEVGNTAPLDELLPQLMAEGVRPITANGILGDPTEATAEDGERLFGQLIDHALREITHD
ncbi:MAG: mycofactocin biosynthesis peptidyl-dipeptidase MftE [Actinobacteria bacterium]|nr:mycofactocin biosynthesis peptidyl-dipeptidase MftE [Actinomycetota bacterium]